MKPYRDYKKGKVDFLMDMGHVSEINDNYLISKNQYQSLQYAILTTNTRYKNLQTLLNKKVGIVQNSSHESYIRKNYEKIELIKFKNVEELLNSLANKRIDAAFHYAQTFNHYLHDQKYQNLNLYS